MSLTFPQFLYSILNLLVEPDPGNDPRAVSKVYRMCSTKVESIFQDRKQSYLVNARIAGIFPWKLESRLRNPLWRSFVLSMQLRPSWRSIMSLVVIRSDALFRSSFDPEGYLFSCTWVWKVSERRTSTAICLSSHASLNRWGSDDVRPCPRLLCSLLVFLAWAQDCCRILVHANGERCSSPLVLNRQMATKQLWVEPLSEPSIYVLVGQDESNLTKPNSIPTQQAFKDRSQMMVRK